MTVNLTDPIFTDETKARDHLEAIRWPDGKPFCPHCGEVEKVYRLKGKSHRPGLIHCNSCGGSFTVTTGSVMESSHVPLNKWVLAFRLMAGSKKGISAHQLHRTIGVTYKTAWFMAHRIREAMRDDKPEPMGGEGKVIEADESYLGGTRHGKNAAGMRYSAQDKMKIVALVERGGKSRAFRVNEITQYEIGAILRQHVRRESTLHTDENTIYRALGKEFASHGTVNHKKREYARGTVTSNTVESYFSVFKRGMRGVYQHCGEQHLQRYLDEFDFRSSNRSALNLEDTERAVLAMKGAAGKRLTYRKPRAAQSA